MLAPCHDTAFDVTGTVNVASFSDVCDAVHGIISKRYPRENFDLIHAIYNDFDALYHGRFPGFQCCDTAYHDVQHVLDVSLAMVRLMDAYESTRSEEQRLGPELAVLGLIVALFHDSGYILHENEQGNGAIYTKTHVSRSANFLKGYLPSIGHAHHGALAEKLVHFTGYEIEPESIDLSCPRHRALGSLLGTADVIAQMADFAYLEKCRDRLYPEFELGGLTKEVKPDGTVNIIYASAEDLLVKTPDFIKYTITHRLEKHFNSYYHLAEVFFDGENLYMQALDNNCRHLEQLLSKNDMALLHGDSLRPQWTMT